MSLVGNLAVLFQLMSFLSRAFDSDNLIMLAVGFLSLIQAIQKQQELSNTNTTVKSSTSTATSSASPTVETFSYYNVHFVNNEAISLQTRENLLAYLEKSAAALHERFPGKEIYLTTTAGANFEGDNAVLLAVDLDDLKSGNITALANEVKAQIPELTSISELSVQ
jgi:hypothetical protein